MNQTSGTIKNKCFNISFAVNPPSAECDTVHQFGALADNNWKTADINLINFLDMDHGYEVQAIKFAAKSASDIYNIDMLEIRRQAPGVCETCTSTVQKVEHLFDGGLWVGGIKAGEKLVTTAAVDASSVVNVLQGFEFTNSADPSDVVVHRSTLLDSKFFSLDAVSHQDFIADYTDLNTVVPETGDLIPQHKPLGIDVHQESYAFALTFANACGWFA